MDIMRGNYEGVSFKVTEIQRSEENADHHIVIVADGGHEAAIIRTEMSGEYRTRYLILPGSVVGAIQAS